jgi:twitching motility protein PilI
MSAASPIAQLREMESKSLAKQAMLPATAERFNEWRGVGFRISGLEIVAKMQNVVEVLHPTPCTRVPSSKPWFEGIANVRGQLVPVTDLHGFLMGEQLPPSKSSRIIVFRLTNTVAGLQVSAVTGIRSFREDMMDQEYPAVSEQLKPFLAGCFHNAGDDFPVFDFNRMVSNERFMHILEKTEVPQPQNRTTGRLSPPTERSDLI